VLNQVGLGPRQHLQCCSMHCWVSRLMLVIMALRLWSGRLLGFEQGLLLATSDPRDAVFSLGGWQGFLRSMSYSGESTSVAQ
jgi:hypothetical protein